MYIRYLPAPSARPRRLRLPAAGLLVAAAATLSSPSLFAETLDFGEALQDFHAGDVVHEVTLKHGGSMHVTAEDRHDDHAVVAILDSSHPGHENRDLGTPNEEFGGPGKGSGGESGKDGENDKSLGNVLVIAGECEGDDGDKNRLDDLRADEKGGTIRLQFSHAGRLSFRLIDVDKREHEPEIELFRDGEQVGEAKGENLGSNSVQHIDLSSFGAVDLVEIELHGSAAIADIQLEVPTVGVVSVPWTQIKRAYK